MAKRLKYLVIVTLVIIVGLFGFKYYLHTVEKEKINFAFQTYQNEQIELWLSNLHEDVIKAFHLKLEDYYYYNLLKTKEFLELSKKDNSDILYLLNTAYNKSGLAKEGDSAIGLYLKKEQPINEGLFVYVSIEEGIYNVLRLNKDAQDKWYISKIEKKAGDKPSELKMLNSEEFKEKYKKNF